MAVSSGPGQSVLSVSCHDSPLMRPTHWRLLQPFGEPVSPDRIEGGHVNLENGCHLTGRGWGDLRGGMASGGGSLGFVACLLLLQPKPCEAWAAAAILSTSGFPSGLSESPGENSPPPTPVHTSKVASQGSTTRFPFTNFSIGNLVRVVGGKGRTVSRP